MRYFYLTFIFSLMFSQSWDNHPELNWQSFETEHFVFYFHEGTERSAIETSKVAEIIYEPVTALYDFYPDSKTAVILKDTDDYSNGMAMFYDNKIEIWTKPMDFDLRGSHRWLQNVFTHEFVHIVQLGASMKFSRTVPGVYIQVIDYEDEKRDDVLYGYPNRIISAPIPGTSVPPWFAEGVAQYMYHDAYYDFWDSHRDMILRDAVLNDRLFSYNEMNTFGKKGIGNEIVYSQGFAFVRYMVSRYGESVLKDITDNLSKVYIYSMDTAFEKVTGDSILNVFEDFKDFLSDKYSDYKNLDNKSLVFIESEGTANINPTWSEDGNKLLFLSDKGNDFFNKTDLYLYDFSNSDSEQSDEAEKIVSGARGAPSWINDSTIVYSKISLPDKYGSKFYDIYKYDMNSEEEKRLTRGERLYSVSYNKDLNQLIAINQYDGTSNIMVSDYSDSLEFKPITSYDNGFQIISVDWLGSDIVFDAVTNHGRDIFTISLNGENQRLLRENKTDERDPYFNEGLNMLVWSEDRDEVFNIYYQNLDGDDIYKMDGVSGGLFYPALSSNGKLALSVFEDGVYKLAIVEDFKKNSDNLPVDLNNEWNDFLLEVNEKTYNIIQNGVNVDLAYTNYNPDNLNTLIMPRLFIDYNTIKPGFYMISTDVLQKLMVFAGGGINSEKDLDLFIQFENHNYRHTPYVNLFWVTRNKGISSKYQDQAGNEYDNTDINSKYFFNLFSADAGSRFSFISDSKLIPGRHKFWLNYQFNNYREKIEQSINQYNQLGEIDFSDKFDFSFDYYRSHILSIEYKYAKQKSHYMRSMLPTNGYKVRLKLSYEFNSFLDGFGVYEDAGTFGSILSPNNTMRLELNFDKMWVLNKDGDHKIGIESNTSLAYISKEDIDDFFYFFGGGMPGLKGYTYYDEGLIGSRKLLQSFYFRTPIFTQKSISASSFYFKDLTFGFVGQVGTVYSGDFNKDNLKASKGIEFRLFGYNVYSYPLAITYEYHIADGKKDGKHYFRVLFDF